MKKIFITGGLGYIGSKLAKEALSKGISVFLYDSLLYEQDHKKILEEIKSTSKDNTNCEFVIGDVRNLELLEKCLKDFKPDYLFHFAELVGIHICEDNPDHTREINYEASKAVIDLCEKLNIPTIYNSTSSVYGDHEYKEALREDVRLPDPTDNYCRNKLLMENYINAKIRNNPKYKIIMLRLATICGLSPRMRLELLPNHFTYCAVAKGIIKISEPESYRAALDIDDIIEAYFAITSKKDWLKSTYNIGQHNLKKIEVAKTIQSIVNCEIGFVGKLGDSRNLQIDSNAFMRDFKWNPTRSFEDTVTKVAKYIRENQKEIEETNYIGIINSPLERWLGMI